MTNSVPEAENLEITRRTDDGASTDHRGSGDVCMVAPFAGAEIQSELEEYRSSK